jgi:uncharacterized membrane protein YqhA
MSKILVSSRYLAIIGVICLLFGALAAFGWGALKTYYTIMVIIKSAGEAPAITIELIELVDAFLIATALLIFPASLYELFIGEVALPEWMLAHNLHELKTKLSSMVVLVMAVKFLEKLVETKDAVDLLYRGIATALISAVLIAFGYFGTKD